MQWSEVSGNLWTIPGARTKNGLPHEVPLPPLALAQLPNREDARVAVFGRQATGFSGWSRCKTRLDVRLNKQIIDALERERQRPSAKGEVSLAPWTLHDMRRTASTWLSEHGELPHVVEAVLNHVSGPAKRGVAGTYNRALYRDQKRAALEQWANHVANLVGYETANIIAIGHS